MAEPSNETKNTANKLTLGSVGKSLLGGAKKAGGVVKKLFAKKPSSELINNKVETPVELLGEIYKMLKIMEEDKRLNHELANSHLEEEELKKEQRNQEIIKALTAKKVKKPKVKPLRDEKGRFKKAEEPTAPSKPTKPGEPGEPPKPPPKGGEPPKTTPKTGEPPKTPPKAGEPTTTKPVEPPKTQPKTGEPAVKPAEQPKPAKPELDKAAEKAAEKAKQEAADKSKREAADKAKEEAKNKAAQEARDKAAEEVRKKTLENADKAQRRSAGRIKSEKPSAPVKTETTPIVPIITGGIAAATAAGIGAAESGGNYDITFGDRVEKGNLVNKTSMTPEQWSEKNLGKRKKLSQMTIAEVQQFQNYKNSVKQGSGAVGKYQFMPTVLDELIKNEKDIKTTDLFDGNMQERLYKKYSASNIKTLKNLGLKEEQLTPGILYMAHYVGPGGAKAVLEMREKGINTTVAAAIKVKYPKTDIAKLLANNKELGEIKVNDFENILSARISKGAPAPHSSNQTGNQIDSSSVQNKDMKNELSKQQTPSSGSTTIVNTPGSVSSPDVEKQDDRPAWYKKLFTPKDM